LAAIVSIALAPAARRRGRDVIDNGTPWGWPLYPWSLFVLLAAAILLRSYALSMAFDPTKGLASGFQLYFLVPLLLSWLVLWFEGADLAKPGRKQIAVVAPLALLALALPGPSGTLAEDRYLRLLQNAAGSPIQITAALLIAYFAYLRLRGIREAEFGLLLTLGGLAFVDVNTVDLQTLTPPQMAPAVAAIALLMLTGITYGSSLRTGFAILLAIAGSSYLLRDTSVVLPHGYAPIHLAVIEILSLGLVFRDAFGRWIAKIAGYALISISLLMLLAYRMVSPEIPAAMHAALALVFAAMAAVYWLKNRRFADLKAGFTCLTAATVLIGEQVITSGLTQLVLRGRRWIAWGIIFFVVGLGVSLIKGGQIRRIRRRLMRFHFLMRRRFGRT
jgi:hypothetical protein